MISSVFVLKFTRVTAERGLLLKKEALQVIEERREEFIQISDQLWDHPELAFQETYSAKLLCDFLEKEGFAVTKGLADIPTAFMGKYGHGRPVIGILGEFDALPGMSQESGALKPKPLKEGAAGHGCGHNLLGAGALAGAVAAKAYIEKTGCSGTVIYYGCPGEEGGSGKTFMVREGVFEDVDCAFTWHPNNYNIVSCFSSLANYQIHYKFSGRSAHAASGPHLGRSALDALELMNMGVQFLREHVKPDVRIHYAITNAGGISPNVVQAEAEAIYLIRSPKVSELGGIYERVNDIARGAALMTGTQVEWELIKACSNILPNTALAGVMQQNMEAIGVPDYTEEERKWMEEINATVIDKRSALLEAASMLGKKGQAIAAMCRDRSFNDFLVPLLPVPYTLSSSSDVGDVSFVTPLAQVATATISANTPGHSWQLTSQGKGTVAHKGMLFAGKIIGGSAIDILEHPEYLEKAKEEWRQRRETENYVCPIPKGVQPSAGIVE